LDYDSYGVEKWRWIWRWIKWRLGGKETKVACHGFKKLKRVHYIRYLVV
jgi:hypothetical protein